MKYGKLEVKEIVELGQEGVKDPKTLYTVDNFDEFAEFKIDKMYNLLFSEASKAFKEKSDKGCAECQFSINFILANNCEDLVFKVSKWAKENIVELQEADIKLIDCFYEFMYFYMAFDAYREDLKKNV